MLGDHAEELVAQHDLLVGPHEVVVADLDHHLAQLVAVQAGVQVGSADAAALHLDQQLALGGCGGLELGDGEVALVTGDSAHGHGSIEAEYAVEKWPNTAGRRRMR